MKKKPLISIVMNCHNGEKFLKESLDAGLGGLKGHRSVGGIRASLYNGCPIESVEALVTFMRDFEKSNNR